MSHPRDEIALGVVIVILLFLLTGFIVSVTN